MDIDIDLVGPLLAYLGIAALTSAVATELMIKISSARNSDNKSHKLDSCDLPTLSPEENELLASALGKVKKKKN